MRVAAKVFAPHTLTPRSPAAPFQFQLEAINLSRVAVARVRYGPAVCITADGRSLAGKLVVSMPWTHPIAVRRGTCEYNCGREQAWLMPGSEPLTVRTGAEHDATSLIVSTEAVEHRLRQLLDRELRRPLVFAAAPIACSWMKVAFSAVSSLLGPAAPPRLLPPILASHIEELFITTLLLNCPHNYSDDLAPRGEPGSPRVVRRVVEAINDQPEHPWTIEELAATAGASIRSVQTNFRRYVGCTPFQMLRSIRLERAHAELSCPRPGDTVTSISMRWGFSNMGRFASAYRRRYGSSPSETLKRST